MEVAVSDCTNLHITYPAMVTGYLFVMRANGDAEAAAETALASVGAEEEPPGRRPAANAIAIRRGGEPVETILRFHSALRELIGRRGIRDDVSRYEAVALALIESAGQEVGTPLREFPPVDSPLRIEGFFPTLYLRYDECYVYGAPELQSITRRLEWSPTSPVFDRRTPVRAEWPALKFEPRLAGGSEEPSAG